MQQPTKEEAIKILRAYSDTQAFYFYMDIGSPTGESAHTLAEFIKTIKTVGTNSIEFHSRRGDFENWIKMLGDDTLSKQMANIPKSEVTGEQLRKRLLQVLHLRYGILRKIAETPAN
jgi:hypothetical protein